MSPHHIPGPPGQQEPDRALPLLHPNTFRHRSAALLFTGFLLFLGCQAPAAVYLNEILFNPPGTDSTNEYVELRGPPNLTLDNGTYLVSVEGDAEGDPGTIQDVFDLSGRRLGQNGFLVLLEKFHRYRPAPLSNVITNSGTGAGWGSGSSSSLHHHGENGQTELENPSCTFFLIQTPNTPAIGDDIDQDDDGVPDSSDYATWTILDSVGVLDNDGAGDVVYGRINFRRDRSPGHGAGVPAGSTVVDVSFTPSYVARNGNTTNWEPTNWVASDSLLGTAPRLFLGAVSTTLGTNTWPAQRAKAALNHVGAPNFGAPVLPAVIVRQTGTNTVVSEPGLKDSYLLSLATRPTGAVSILISAEPPVQVSIDGGLTYAAQRSLSFVSTTPRKILVRATDDTMAGPPQRIVQITHTLLNSGDTAAYPTNLLILPVSVTVLDTNVVLLSEVKVNPPGPEDAPYEFIELSGPARRILTNLWLVALAGDSAGNPGRVEFAFNLSGLRFGTNGLLVVAAPNPPYVFSPGTAVASAPQLASAGGALNNVTFSLLLLGTAQAILEGDDLDNGNNGVLEGLPSDAFLLDAIAWNHGGNNDVIYGGVDLSQPGFTPDAATRLPGNRTPRSAAAWGVGDLAGMDPGSLFYDATQVSTNLPGGAAMTPGVINRSGPRFSPNPLPALSGVIDDPENETITLTITDADSPITSLTVTVTSTNPAVVPDQNIILTPRAGGIWTMSIHPVGVGYSQLIVTVSDGVYQRRGWVDYAASSPGVRPGARWHTGVSDASTAIPIDANWMLVGDDENQVLRLFSRNHSGPAAAGHDFSEALQLIDHYPSGAPKEVDIEASTRSGNHLFWLGSHSHAADATERTNRARLFSTDLSGTGTNIALKFLGHYDFLKLDLIAWDANNLHGKGANYYGLTASGAVGTDPKAVDGSGFNIEGLCMAPASTSNAYVAFRAPLVPPATRDKALLIPVRNLAQLAMHGGAPGSALFGPPLELNLGGRGVRSIEGHSTNYLIVAGPPGAGSNAPPPGDFKLFTWSGQPGNAPVERDTDLSHLNPEGIVDLPAGSWSATNLVQLVSDNGTKDYYDDGTEAKHLPIAAFKKFRVDTVALGNIASAPVIRSLEATDGALVVRWFAREGTTYRIQTKSILDGTWTDVPGDVTASDATATKTLAPPPEPQCFLRVTVVP